MDIDFNNLRKQTAYSLDNVIKILNSGILDETKYASYEKEDGKIKHFEGNVLVKKEDLQEHIDLLRQNVWLLLCCYEKDNPNYQCVYEDVENSGGLSKFND